MIEMLVFERSKVRVNQETFIKNCINRTWPRKRDLFVFGTQ